MSKFTCYPRIKFHCFRTLQAQALVAEILEPAQVVLLKPGRREPQRCETLELLHDFFIYAVIMPEVRTAQHIRYPALVIRITHQHFLYCSDRRRKIAAVLHIVIKGRVHGHSIVMRCNFRLGSSYVISAEHFNDLVNYLRRIACLSRKVGKRICYVEFLRGCRKRLIHHKPFRSYHFSKRC